MGDIVKASGAGVANAGSFRPGPDSRRAGWKPGQSGGGGSSSWRQRREFEQKFLEALVGEIPVEEVAKILAAKAREGLPWAILAILNRIAPENLKIDVTKTEQPPVFDLSRLSDSEVDAFVQLARRAAGDPPGLSAAGAGEAPAVEVAAELLPRSLPDPRT